jgi:hypothetical protein
VRTRAGTFGACPARHSAPSSFSNCSASASRTVLSGRGAYFLLQDIDVPQWQENQMVTFEVADLDAYRAELEAKGLAATFTGVKLRPPTQFPWGREIHLIDPGGVCWHVRQTSA